jgi:hypothetical protein
MSLVSPHFPEEKNINKKLRASSPPGLDLGWENSTLVSIPDSYRCCSSSSASSHLFSRSQVQSSIDAVTDEKIARFNRPLADLLLLLNLLVESDSKFWHSRIFCFSWTFWSNQIPNSDKAGNQLLILLFALLICWISNKRSPRSNPDLMDRSCAAFQSVQNHGGI